MIGRSLGGGATALWSGLVLCGVTLAGIVAGTAYQPAGAGADSAETATVAAGNRLDECTPAIDARLADPSRSTLLPEGGDVSVGQAAEYERQLREALRPLRGHEAEPTRVVPVVVHVISASDGRGNLGDWQIRRQIDVLNRAYRGGYAFGDEGADTGFRFRLREINRTVNDGWFRDFSRQRDEIRERLHRGGADTLNLYTTKLDSGLLGYSTFPQDQKSHPKRDGVVISYDTLPGGDRYRFNHGHTATHEIGHWLGLFHTFQNGCDEPGDYVDDTAYEREAASGCPRGRDTCRRDPGEDPITNFMNYSEDACMTHFTRGQGKRMADHWRAFRSGANEEEVDPRRAALATGRSSGDVRTTAEPDGTVEGEESVD
ncbi:zinc metalloprotease [Nocardiopsis sp. EMB25]|nr:zinc metalloprotease [Nocardiopsis sp. EMB25]MCY9782332.1 zinc metalloprotease [Nocardiopsis sp. EMB25]